MGPVNVVIGLVSTETGLVGLDEQPVEVCVKTKVVVPVARPVTSPALLTEATPGLELDQTPPVEGDKLVVLPIQMLDAPLTETVGRAVAVMLAEATAEQPLRLVTVTLYRVEGAEGYTVTACEVAFAALALH